VTVASLIMEFNGPSRASGFGPLFMAAIWVPWIVTSEAHHSKKRQTQAN